MEAAHWTALRPGGHVRISAHTPVDVLFVCSFRVCVRARAHTHTHTHHPIGARRPLHTVHRHFLRMCLSMPSPACGATHLASLLVFYVFMYLFISRAVCVCVCVCGNRLLTLARNPCFHANEDETVCQCEVPCRQKDYEQLVKQHAITPIGGPASNDAGGGKFKADADEQIQFVTRLDTTTLEALKNMKKDKKDEICRNSAVVEGYTGESVRAVLVYTTVCDRVPLLHRVAYSSYPTAGGACMHNTPPSAVEAGASCVCWRAAHTQPVCAFGYAVLILRVPFWLEPQRCKVCAAPSARCLADSF